MIGRQIMQSARRDSNAVSTDNPADCIRDAGIDLEALNEMILAQLTAYATLGLSVGEAATAGFASGFELGVRAARIESGELEFDLEPIP